MKMQLPKPKKTLKTFILEEDAKITDKAATKVAIMLAFMAFHLMSRVEDANAQGHSDSHTHINNLNTNNDFGTGYHVGDNPTTVAINQIHGKSVLTAHGNHYNHQDGSGQGILGIIALVVIAYFTAGLGAVAAGAASASTTVLGLGFSTTAGLAGAGAAAVGSASSGGGHTQGGPIDTGTPYTMPPQIIDELKSQQN